MIFTPDFRRAARTAFFSSMYRRTALVRRNGVWSVKVLS